MAVRETSSAAKFLFRLLILLAPSTSALADPEWQIENEVYPDSMIAGQEVPAQTLFQRMNFHHVPGVSVAVIKDGRIEWAKGYGVAEAGTDRAVTTDTLFQAASISKSVAALATLALVDSGTLELDRDVNESLRTWQIPDNSYTTTEKVTLRRILSHTAGLTVHGFDGYSITDTLPTLTDILDGRLPAN